ncbi:hypothetical protein SK128_011439 [Halocaridina rubra]|uniref:Uncharacterized protein n=1 Tax=Halocaridina rubra TaxID=373956 RepID=A0AAN8XEQ3_HALRR
MVGAYVNRPVWALGGAYSPPHPAGHSPSLLDVLGGEPGGPPLDGASLTVALDVVQAWVVLITVGFTIVLFIFLAFCVCAKKDDSYDEYELSQGITTVKVCHDGGENGLGSYPRINGSNTPRGSDEASEASSRCTLKRELPAIPQSAQPDPAPIECKVERTQSQHSSDLYAAVGDVNDGGNSMAKVIGGVQVLPSNAIGQGGRAAVIRDASVTSPTSPTSPSELEGSGAVAHSYAKVKKNHPYAHVKLPKKDHPYAKVVRDDSEDPETDTDNYDDPKAITKDKSPGWKSESAYEPAPPVPEKRFDIEEDSAQASAPPEGGGLMSTSMISGSSAKGPSSPRSPHLNTRSSMAGSDASPTSSYGAGMATDRPPSTEIPAAMAISGRTPANEELPYMTPPLHHQNGEAGIEMPSQQNFSGDSQDSRGYTSISVREPLAALKAQTPGASTTQPLQNAPGEGEGYYMTVSDDSADEMYACIYEGTRGVGSETYAQIEPRTTHPPPPPQMPSPSHPPSTPSPLSTRGGSQPPPAPPSVDSLRHVVHSRQASSSSAASTVMGSPGAEKRGTRSPLPPLPQGDSSLYSASSPQPPQPPHSPPRSVPPVERPTQRALEEMYAKVMKKQRPGHSRGNSSGGGESDNGSESSSRRGSVDVGGARWGSHASTPPTTPRQSVDLGAMTHSLIETRNVDASKSISRAKSYETASIWSSSSQKSQPLPKPSPDYGNFYSGGSDPGYETVKNSEPPYASVDRPEENYPGYETVKPTSDLDSEPGYETLKHREEEPGYETVSGQVKTASEPGYETVASKPPQDEDEPGYETVSHQAEVADPGYEIVKGKTTSEFGDPGYEELQTTVRHARTTSENDPNYEQLKFTSRRSSDGDSEPGYEVVKKVDTESTYEYVRDYDTQENYPQYEKIDKSEKKVIQDSAPVYASITRKRSKSPEKEVQKEKTSIEERVSSTVGLLESDLDNISPAVLPKDFKLERELELIETKNENQNVALTSAPVKSPSPPLKKSPSPPSKKSPDTSPEKAFSLLTLESPDKSTPVVEKTLEKDSKESGKDEDGSDSESPCLTKSPDSMSEMSECGVPPPSLTKALDKITPEKNLEADIPPVPEIPEEAPIQVKSPEETRDLTEKSENESILLQLNSKNPDKEVSLLVDLKDDDTTGDGKKIPDRASGEFRMEDAEMKSTALASSSQVAVDDLLQYPPSKEAEVGEQDTWVTMLPSAEQSSSVPVSSFEVSSMLATADLIKISSDKSEPASIDISEDGDCLPPPPLSDTPEMSDTYGSENRLPLSETHSLPMETVNPLYVVDNAIPSEGSAVDESTHEAESHIGLCGVLPPPPPPIDDDSVFPNDLPPPLPEAATEVNTLPEDAPPPLVPPAEVEGLDDMLNLTNMGSSSSGSTAGQLGSAHGSSEKDLESPQEMEGSQVEGAAASDLPPPPPPPAEQEAEQESDEELDNSVSSGYGLGFTAGGITVTVNPMADMEEKSESPELIPSASIVKETTPVVPPSPAVSAIISSSTGSQSSSSGSGSQDTGSGSIESVVTVDCAAPLPPPTADGVKGDPERQQSAESASSTEGQPADTHEEATEV